MSLIKTNSHKIKESKSKFFPSFLDKNQNNQLNGITQTKLKRIKSSIKAQANIISECLQNYKKLELNNSEQKHLSSIDEVASINAKSKKYSIISYENKDDCYEDKLKNFNLKHENLKISPKKKSKNQDSVLKIINNSCGLLHRNNSIQSLKKLRYSHSLNVSSSLVSNKNSGTNIILEKEKPKRLSVLTYSYYNNLGSYRSGTDKIKSTENDVSMRGETKYFSFLKLSKKKSLGGFENLFIQDKEINHFPLEEIYRDYPFIKKIKHKLKIIYLFCSISCFLAFISACIDAEIYITKSWEYLTQEYNITKDNNSHNLFKREMILKIKNRKISKSENFFRFLNLFFSLSAFVLLLIHEIYKNIHLKEKETKDEHRYGLHKIEKYNYNDSLIHLLKPENKIKFSLKLLVILIFYPLNINQIIIHKYNFMSNLKINIYSLNSIFVFINLIKFCMIFFNFILEYSNYNSIITKRLCQNRLKLTPLFRLRSLFNNYPLLVSFCLILLLTIVILLFKRYFDVFSNTENLLKIDQENPFLNKYIDNLYFALSILSHLWFGDQKPVTLWSKIMVYFSSTFGMVFLCIWTYYFNSMLISLNSEENKAYTKLVKLRNKENSYYKASTLIKDFLSLRLLHVNFLNYVNSGIDINYKKNVNNLILHKFIIIMKFRLDIKDFKNETKIARNFSLPFTDILGSLCRKLDESNLFIKNRVNKLNDIYTIYNNYRNNYKHAIKNIKKMNSKYGFLEVYLTECHNKNYYKFIKEIKPGLIDNSKIFLNAKSKSKDSFLNKNRKNNLGGCRFSITKKVNTTVRNSFKMGIGNLNIKK